MLIFFCLISMCVCKRKIPNPGYNKHDLLSFPFIEVNCGHCWQCILERSNNFTFRVVWEVLHSKCVPFYSTLTYNPRYLPILHYYDKQNKELKSISVWNRQHVQRFHKTLRRQLQYYYGIDSSAFKYLVTCERGTDRQYKDFCGRVRIAQELPHYHCLHMLNISPDLLPIRERPKSYYKWLSKSLMTDSVSSFFKYLLSTKWFFGHVDNVMYCRDIAAASSYITKYITKNIDEKVYNLSPSAFYKLRDLDDFQRNKRVSRFRKSDGSFKVLPPVCLTDLLPRSFSSINLGLGFLFDKSFDELTSYFLGLKKVTLPFSHSSSLINLPSYYYNKVCRSLKRLHIGKYYSCCGVVDGVGCEVVKYTKESFTSSLTWDNIHGCYMRFRPRVYTQSSLSEFGKRVKRLRSFKSVQRLRDNVVNSLRYKSMSTYLHSVFTNLTSDVPSDVKRLTQPLKCIFDYPRSGLFSDIIGFRRSFVPDTDIDNVVTFARMCQFTSSHLRHVEFLNNYNNKVGRIALDNPDLFLNHYV